MNTYNLVLIVLLSHALPCLSMEEDNESSMHIVTTYKEWFGDQSNKNAMEGRGEIPVEREAYIYLEQLPLPQKVSYVPAPFYYLLYNDKIGQLESMPSPCFSGQDSFSVTHVEHPKRLLPLLQKWNIKVLFAVNAEKDDLNVNHYGITLKPFPYSPMAPVTPSKNKDILYVKVLANRIGPIGDTKLKFDSTLLKITDIK